MDFTIIRDLSYVYPEMKAAEEKKHTKDQKSYNIAIHGLFVISLILFVSSLISIFQREDCFAPWREPACDR